MAINFQRLNAIFLLVCLVMTATSAHAQQSINLFVPSAVLQGFDAFKAKRTVHSIKDYSFSDGYIRDHQDPYVNLEVIELVLLVQALQLGGYDGDIKIKASNSALITRKIEKGSELISGVSIWRQRTRGTSASLWISDPIIRQGEFQLGLYSCGSSQVISNKDELNTRRISSHTNWPMVTEFLQSLELADVSLSSNWGQVVEQVCSGNSDLIAAPFTDSNNLMLNYQGQALPPVKNVRLHVAGTRHFVISRLHPKGKSTYFSLQRGLRKLRLKGNIARALRQSGFLSETASSWNYLN